jgi:N-acetylmuramoyl-L-alanine amidase
MVGEILLKEGDKDEAANAFGEVITKYPKGDMHPKASAKLLEMNYKNPAAVSKKKVAKKISKPKTVPSPPVASNVAPPPKPKKKYYSSKDKKVVIIDAGHGGKDAGAIGVNGLHEKKVVLDIALKLKNYLEDSGHYKVIMTRKRDRFIPLDKRTKIANKNNSAIFISIHANASKNKRLYGIETFFQGLPKTEEDKETAARENMVFIDKELPSKDDMLLFILSDMKNNYLINESSHLAEVVQSHLIKGMQKKYSRIRNLGVKQALFFVLNDAQIPSILVEVSFLTHSIEGKRLASSTYRKNIAYSIYNGIESYTAQMEKIAKAD